MGPETTHQLAQASVSGLTLTPTDLVLVGLAVFVANALTIGAWLLMQARKPEPSPFTVPSAWPSPAEKLARVVDKRVRIVRDESDGAA
jgi:hypothetical protein